MHDVQMVVEGDAAAALGERARELAGSTPAANRSRRDPRGTACWPRHVEPDFEDLPVGIMRTLAALEERDQDIREIERATVAAIASAERFIYIENQYVTSKTACEALVARMRAQPSLEAIVVTTREPGGWLEAGTMGVGRQQFMAQFAAPELAKRIQFVAPLARCTDADPETEHIAPGGTLSIHVHAKVLVVDDDFLRIGSSNLNNRSMGFDTECDLAIEATNAAQRRAIASIRNRLLAEHWGSDEKSVAEALDFRRAGRRSARGRYRACPCSARRMAPSILGSRRGAERRARRRSGPSSRSSATNRPPSSSSCSSAIRSASCPPRSSSPKPRASAICDHS